MSRSYTNQEAIDNLLDRFIVLLNYWENEDIGSKSKLEGLLFSILTTLDGASSDIPAFNLTPAPHPDDKEYHVKEEENYYGETPINEDVYLHEMLVNKLKTST